MAEYPFSLIQNLTFLTFGQYIFLVPQKSSTFFSREGLERWAFTLPETNIAPENGWLECYFPIGKAYFQGLC